MKLTLACLLSALSLAAQTVPGRFILELSESPSRSAPRATILRQQQNARAALASRKVRVRATVTEVVNAIVVEGTDAKALSALPGVRKVHAVKVLRTSLDHALPVMKIPDAWQRAGGPSSAGAGIRIGIIDTGIDPHHAGFQDPSLVAPEGFPKYSSDANRTLTGNKVIVARSYDSLTALDQEGHGTAISMIAAGVRHAAQNGNTISGVAPKAFLGAYRANEGASGTFTSDNILRAIDDAVKDGMDVINMSLGAPGLTVSDNEILTSAINQAVARGVIVVTAAGNGGPDPLTVSDTGAAPRAISVGSTLSDREPAVPGVKLPEMSLVYAGLAASNSADAEPIGGRLIDLMPIDSTGLACAAVAPGALAGKIVLLQRGSCAFEDKLKTVAAAGALGAIVFNNADDPARIVMQVGTQISIKAVFLSRADGLQLRQKLAGRDAGAVVAFKEFETSDPDRLANYSSRGPSLDLAIKPDLVAVGTNVGTAWFGTQPNRPETSPYVIGSGTSLAAPMVAGAAAVLKAARPGLTVAQYRSLLVNSATRYPSTAQAVAVQQSGAGMLNLPGALSSNTVTSPLSLSFGEAGDSAIVRELNVTNLGTAAESYTLTLFSGDSAKPAPAVSSFTLGAGESRKVDVQFEGPGIPPGQYQGLIEIAGSTGSLTRVPYWAAVRAREADRISLAIVPPAGVRGTLVQVAFRVIDAAGFHFAPPVEVVPVSGGGEVANLQRLGAEYPGLYLATLRLGPAAGMNVFRITSAGIEREVRISGEK